MAILINKDSKIIVQGFTGKIGTFHAEEMIEYGTNVVGGVTPGKGGQTHLKRPVFNTVKEAAQETGADASILFVPPAFAADSAMEAADAGIKTLVAITDGIPAHDMIKVKRYMRRYKNEERMTLVGPNCAGVISPGKCMLGIMPGHIYKEGNVGVIGRSGTLGYEAAQQMKNLGIGISTSVGIGGDPINGSSFKDHLQKFEQDDETKVIKYYQDRGLYFNSDGTHTDYGGMKEVGKVLSFESGTNSNSIVFDVGTASPDSSFSGVTTTVGSKEIDLGVNFTNGLANPEINRNTGDVIYIDNRKVVTRDSKQKEDIKIILEF